MGGISKKLLFTSRYLVVSLLVVAVGTPMVTLSQEETATTTPESLVVADEATVSTTTSPIATTTPYVATSTDEFLSPVSELEEETATTTGEVLGESTASESEEDVEENIEEEEDFFGQTAAAILSVFTPPPPRLLVREFKRRVTPDSRAFHSCEAEVFRIDVSGKVSAKARIALQRDSDAPYEIEIGGLPHGINITFSKNSGYRYTQGAGDRSLELAIINQPGSQKGNFGVPIIYTQKGIKDSLVICQINIVNL